VGTDSDHDRADRLSRSVVQSTPRTLIGVDELADVRHHTLPRQIPTVPVHLCACRSRLHRTRSSAAGSGLQWFAQQATESDTCHAQGISDPRFLGAIDGNGRALPKA
jgi:hypothetical protein